jgi:hypothetical protein
MTLFVNNKTALGEQCTLSESTASKNYNIIANPIYTGQILNPKPACDSHDQALNPMYNVFILTSYIYLLRTLCLLISIYVLGHQGDASRSIQDFFCLVCIIQTINAYYIA